MAQNGKMESTYLSLDNPPKAVGEMIKITENLCGFMEKEMNAVAANDGVGFLGLQKDKEKAAEIYHAAARELQSLPGRTLRPVEPALLDRLEEAQKQLRAIAASSAKILEKLSPQDHVVIQNPDDDEARLKAEDNLRKKK